jgi:APA family basic amino acid/polyamine antiporter
VGPRVTCAMAKENHLWRKLAIKNSHGIPVRAIWMHVLISVALALTGSFEKVLLYAGFVLQLVTSMTVASSLFIKDTQAHTYKAPFKPLFQLIFLAFNAWSLVFTYIDKPVESSIGIGILLVGLIIYFFDKPHEMALHPSEE